MLSDKEIIQQAQTRIQDSLLVTQWWRANEVRDNYGIYEGSQWLMEDYSRQLANNMPARTINKAQAIIDAMTGFYIQNRSQVKLVPRTLEPKESGYADLGNDGIKWIQDVSNYDMVKSLATNDMFISGLGFVEFKVGYGDNKIYNSSTTDSGNPWCERVFPYFMIWDVTTRDKNLEGANWICRAKIVDKETLSQYLKGIMPDEKEAVDAEFGASVDARFLDFFDTVMIVKSLGVIYHYQWREKKYFYRFRNPLIGFEGDPSDPQTQQVVELAKVLRSRYHFDPATENFFTIPSKDLQKIKDAFALIGIENPEYIKTKKWVYYRADIVGNRVINKGENFSQSGFSIQCMTGKYDEIRQCYYGAVRSLKEPQRLLNQAVSDYEGFLKTIPKGGVFIELDAVPDMEGFRDTYTKAAQVTVLSSGALSAGKMLPKEAPPIPSGLLEMIDYAGRAMMEVLGLTPDFMGMVDSKLMTAKLNSQLVRQGMMVLAPYSDSIGLFTKMNGILFLDILRVLLDNEEGRLIGHITPEGNKVNVPLMEENLCPEYDIVIEEVPMTPDERQETFAKMMELAQMVPQILPIAMEYSPFKPHEINAIKTLLQPSAPPEPDPLQQALLESEVQLKHSLSKKQDAEANKASMDTLLKQKELEHSDLSIDADIVKKIRSAEYDRVRAVKEQENIKVERRAH
jgi:hypothetical protein